MTTHDLRQQMDNQISTIQLRTSELHNLAQLSPIREKIAGLEKKLASHKTTLVEIRRSGYVFEKNLEGLCEDLQKRWEKTSNPLQAKLNQEALLLQAELQKVDSEIHQLIAVKGNPLAAQSRLPAVQSAIDSFESKAKATGISLEGTFSGIENEITACTNHLDEVAMLLKNIQSASFNLLPTEAGISSIKAIWLKNGEEHKGDPEGILFLTDQRLIFEQREEVSTKKVLFISTEKKMIQQLCFEFPLGCITNIQTRKTGLFKNEDVIDLALVDAFASSASLHIWKDNGEYKGLINKAVRKEFDAERVRPVDQAVLTEIRNVPTQCPKCGGTWSKPVVRGQEAITCDYCGYLYRL